MVHLGGDSGSAPEVTTLRWHGVGAFIARDGADAGHAVTFRPGSSVVVAGNGGVTTVIRVVAAVTVVSRHYSGCNCLACVASHRWTATAVGNDAEMPTSV